MTPPFDPGRRLPRVIPIFPLPGALLLPQGRLPLNVFEPRYLAMTRRALADEQRVIGMIQPDGEAGGDRPSVYGTGCAGRITAFSETDDGRYLITLSGLCRFAVVEELPLEDGYRRVVADYEGFRHDLAPAAPADIDRERLIGTLRAWLDRKGVEADWDAIEEAPDDRLVASLAMACPFGVSEKQALLEAPGPGERAEIMTALLEMALAGDGGGAQRFRQ